MVGTGISVLGVSDFAQKEVDWKSPQDVIVTFGVSRVDTMHDGYVCIDICGNDVRVILRVKYGYGEVFVYWIGWHKDYDKLII